MFDQWFQTNGTISNPPVGQTVQVFPPNPNRRGLQIRFTTGPANVFWGAPFTKPAFDQGSYKAYGLELPSSQFQFGWVHYRDYGPVVTWEMRIKAAAAGCLIAYADYGWSGLPKMGPEYDCKYTDYESNAWYQSTAFADQRTVQVMPANQDRLVVWRYQDSADHMFNGINPQVDGSGMLINMDGNDQPIPVNILDFGPLVTQAWRESPDTVFQTDRCILFEVVGLR